MKRIKVVLFFAILIGLISSSYALSWQTPYNKFDDRYLMLSGGGLGYLTVTGYVNLALNWSMMQNYPVACPSGEFITLLNDSVTCTAPTAADVDPGSFPSGNYVFQGKLNVTSGNDVCISGGKCLSTVDSYNTSAEIQNIIVGGNMTGTVGNMKVNQSAISSGNIVDRSILADDLASDIGLGWKNLTDYATACSGSQAMQGVGDTLTCVTHGNSSTDVWKTQLVNTTANIRAVFSSSDNISYDSTTGKFYYNGSTGSGGAATGDVNWTQLQNYPVVCPTGTFISLLNDSTTCTAPTAEDVDSGTFPGYYNMTELRATTMYMNNYLVLTTLGFDVSNLTSGTIAYARLPWSTINSTIDEREKTNTTQEIRNVISGKGNISFNVSSGEISFNGTIGNGGSQIYGLNASTSDSTMIFIRANQNYGINASNTAWITANQVYGINVSNTAWITTNQIYGINVSNTAWILANQAVNTSAEIWKTQLVNTTANIQAAQLRWNNTPAYFNRLSVNSDNNGNTFYVNGTANVTSFTIIGGTTFINGTHTCYNYPTNTRCNYYNGSHIIME